MTAKPKYTVDKFAFIGRTYDEYCRIFNLTEYELNHNRFLDCPAGACSFVSEANKKNINAIACDIEYGKTSFSFKTICQNELEKIKIGFANAMPLFNWNYYKNLDTLLTHRKRASDLFISDYSRYPKRYIKAQLPILPFADNAFDIVLSAHFLFLYADRLDYNFHLNAIKEMLRVSCKELRLYPLLGLDGVPYQGLDQLTLDLDAIGYTAKPQKTEYEFIKGADHFLSIKRTTQ